MTEEDQSREIFIGDKKLGKYVKALMYRLNDLEEASAVARGKFITKAVDSVEILKREEDIDVTDIRITTDNDENDDGSTYSVSKIVIDVEGEVDFDPHSDEEDEESE